MLQLFFALIGAVAVLAVSMVTLTVVVHSVLDRTDCWPPHKRKDILVRKVYLVIFAFLSASILIPALVFVAHCAEDYDGVLISSDYGDEQVRFKSGARLAKAEYDQQNFGKTHWFKNSKSGVKMTVDFEEGE